MKKVQLTTNLYLHEYIPEEMYLKYSPRKSHYLIGLLDHDLIRADQFLRDRHGQLNINTWAYGGDRNWSGIRLPGFPYYRQFSQHPYGRASDKVFKLITAEEVRADIKINYVKLYKSLGITCIESGVSWLHSDNRYHNFRGYKGTGLLIVPKPKKK